MPAVQAERDIEIEMEDKIAYCKLQTVCEIRKGMGQLELVRQRLVSDLEVSDAERRSLSEYRREMDLLLQEKMTHVEELRQIHADINAIEDVIKQSDECRRRSLQSARRLHTEYRPLKQHVDSLRRQLGLEPLADISELEPELPVSELLTDNGASETDAGQIEGRALLENSPGAHTNSLLTAPGSLAAAVAASQFSAAAAAAAAGFMSGSHHHLQPPLSKQLHQQQQCCSGSLNKLTVNTAVSAANSHCSISQTNSAASPTAFRQQPPPMKSCLSCHQQIHRNAPICPLCKAKSRSRNPKKPKKKD